MQSANASTQQLFDADKFTFIYTCDLDDVSFRIKIGTLEGTLECHQDGKPLSSSNGNVATSDNLTLSAHLYITCQLYSNGKLICPAQQTSYKQTSKRFEWNEWILFPIKFSDLPRDAMLAFTFWDTISPDKSLPIGGTGISIFGKHGALRKGIYDLRVWNNMEANNGNCLYDNNGKWENEEVRKVNKLKKRYRNGQLAKVDWLDRLSFLELEKVTQNEKKNCNCLYLSIEFSKVSINGIEQTVVYFEKGAEESCQFSFIENDLVIIPDPEMNMENVVESKHHKLSRSIRTGMSDRDLRPNASTRDQLRSIVLYPPTKVLTSEEQDLIWKLRFYLVNQKKALAKFLKSVNWQLTNEANQAIELLSIWEQMDIEDALELLTPQFQHPVVRRYAVSRLKHAPDEELLLYLLQLVQALKYEDFAEIRAAHEKEKQEQCFEMGITDRKTSVSSSETTEDSCVNALNIESLSLKDNSKNEIDLATFLINRASTNDNLANYFFWYLMVECEDSYSGMTKEKVDSAGMGSHDIRICDMYVTVMKRFSIKLERGGAQFKLRRKMLARQQSFVEKLVQLMKVVARENGNRKKKIERLQLLLSDQETFKTSITPSDPLPLPLDPATRITGIIPDKATLFKSALMPGRLVFSATGNEEYTTIFKHGDDLRQDQLILQMITLMDKLLRRENLDLKLTPYRVLATSSKHGFVQFIDSISVAEVLASEGSIQNYFRRHAPANAPSTYGISPDVMDAYVKSCAGYCVITYLLGVGDRHLDNLLLTKTGKLFHIDFGFILGRDPKPMPPPMKLSREMVDAMGGTNSEHYQSFRNQCFTAYLHLRRHANLILNLFSLMVDANVPDIALEPDKTVKKVQDKFRLDLSDEEAVHYMQALIDVSVKAVIPAMVEQIHKMAQYWRN